MFLKNRTLLTKKIGLFDWRSKYTSVPGEEIPLDFSNLHTWLRSDIGISLDSNDRVSSWLDPISGNDFIQNTSTIRPRYIESDIINNNKPAVYFTGQDGDLPRSIDRLVSTLPNTSWNFLHYGTGATVFMVARDLNGASNRMMLSTSASGGNAVTGWQFYTGTNSTPATYMAVYVRDQAPEYYASAQAITQLNTNSILVHSNGLSRSPANIFRHNATTISSGNYVVVPDPETAGDASNTLTIGAGSPAGQAADKIIVSEIIIYDRALSLSEIQAVESYLNNRYNVI